MPLSLAECFPLFILASSVCKYLQCLTSTLTQGGEGGHLFRFTCSVVLWGGRNTANKYHWHVWRVLTVCGPPWVCPSSQQCAFQVYTAQAPGCSAGHSRKQTLCFMHFPGLSCSGSDSQVLCKGSDSVGCAFCAFCSSEQLR